MSLVLAPEKLTIFRTNSLLTETGNLLDEQIGEQGSASGRTGNLLEPGARTGKFCTVCFRLAPGAILRFAK